ncbi:MAG TPA: hypothetical protein VK894_01610 [Jiangellales bacterium]|nr:hypothetical protein [Jiangellales bacterium]
MDPRVVQTVAEVRDRFGAEGLRDLVEQAQAAILDTLEAGEDLAEALHEPRAGAGAEPPPSG